MIFCLHDPRILELWKSLEGYTGKPFLSKMIVLVGVKNHPLGVGGKDA